MMDDVYTNRSDNFTDLDYFSKNFPRVGILLKVVDLIVIFTGLPLALLAIVAVSFLARKDHGAPVFIINLLISDLIQLCCKVAWVIDGKRFFTILPFHSFGLMASIGFMVCISLERYLVVTKPLWYRFRRDIRITVLVCVVVWILPLVYFLPYYFRCDDQILDTVFGVFLLIPFPLFIFFLVGTLKAISAARSVPHDEKRRIVYMLVAVLLIYTLLFLPSVIWLVLNTRLKNNWNKLAFLILILICHNISPLADLTFYFLIRKGSINDLLKSLCCKMSNRQKTENTNNEVISGSCTEGV